LLASSQQGLARDKFSAACDRAAMNASTNKT